MVHDLSFVLHAFPTCLRSTTVAQLSPPPFQVAI